MNKIFKSLTIFIISIFGFAYFISCKKVQVVMQTTSDVNIYDYLKQHPDTFSELVKIVDKSGYAGFLNAYGSYTMFAPTNNGVKAYLTEINKTSVDQLTEDEAKNIVKFHLLEDTLTTASFKDGKLPLVTMYGQYLVTSVANDNGISSFLINRQAIITQGNIRTGNGFIHEIDHVLKPATKTIAQLIDADPNFSIFRDALVATGFYDTLNTINNTNPSRRWLTVFAETNKALADSGITSFTALKTRYSKTGNPQNPSDSLFIYVAYHISPDAKYLADIISAPSHQTLQPLEVITSKLDGQTVLLNDIDFNGTHEQGIALDRSASDISATNGVLHTATAHFRPKVRVPVPVYWDVADFPEVRRLASVFRKKSQDFPYGTLKDISWDQTTNSMSYSYPGGSTTPVYYNDYLTVPMGTTSRHHWIEFRTPLLVKGKYWLWICYRAAKGSGTVTTTYPTSGSNCPVQVSFDGVVTERPFNFCIKRPFGTDGELQALGWKRYSSDVNDSLPANNFMSGRFVGIVDVPTTDRHIVRFDVLPAASTGNPSNFLDMIHFIPVDWSSQYLPRFARDGSLQYY
jgi:uncharacterized surface protein with fasciclin (FAS1) repeats